jgi:predicted DNA-binding transcriptional regulator AlpA
LNPDELLSMQQAALVLNVSMPTLYAIVDERGELKPAEERKLGKQRRRYFRRGDVEALRQRRTGAEAGMQ